MAANRSFSRVIPAYTSGDYTHTTTNKRILNDKYETVSYPTVPTMKGENYDLYLALKNTQSSLLYQPDNGEQLSKNGIWTGNELLLDLSALDINAIQQISSFTLSGETIILNEPNVMEFPPPINQDNPHEWNTLAWPGFVVDPDNKLTQMNCK